MRRQVEAGAAEAGDRTNIKWPGNILVQRQCGKGSSARPAPPSGNVSRKKAGKNSSGPFKTPAWSGGRQAGTSRRGTDVRAGHCRASHKQRTR